MYIGNDEFVPFPLLLVVGMMVLTVALIKWGERAQHRTGITPRRRLVIQLTSCVTLAAACGLLIAFAIVNHGHLQ